MARSWGSADLIQPGTAVHTSAAVRKHGGCGVSHPSLIELAELWMNDCLEKEPETLRNHMSVAEKLRQKPHNSPKPLRTHPAGQTHASRNRELIDTFFQNTCERTNFCHAISVQGCLSWTVAGSAVSRQEWKEWIWSIWGNSEGKEKRKTGNLYKDHI